MAVSLTQLAERIDGARGEIAAVGRDVKELKEQGLDRRISSLESTVSWLSRLLAGALVTAVVAIAVAFGTRG